MAPFILVHTYPSTPTAKLSFIPSTAKPASPSELHCQCMARRPEAQWEAKGIKKQPKPSWFLCCRHNISVLQPWLSSSSVEAKTELLYFRRWKIGCTSKEEGFFLGFWCLHVESIWCTVSPSLQESCSQLSPLTLPEKQETPALDMLIKMQP